MKKENKVSVIVFNENHWGCIATLNNELPSIILAENEDLFEGLGRLRESLNIEWTNELLNYILNKPNTNEYIFIVSSKDTEDKLEWVSGEDIEKLGELKISSWLLNDLLERFKNGFMLDGTRYNKES